MIKWIKQTYSSRVYHAFDDAEVQTERAFPRYAAVYDEGSPYPVRWRTVHDNPQPIEPSARSFCNRQWRRLPLQSSRTLINPDPMTTRSLCSGCFKVAMERGIFA